MLRRNKHDQKCSSWYTLVVFHVLHRCICCIRVKSLWKVLTLSGITIQILRVTTLIAIDVISRHNYLKSEYNATVQCIFHEVHGLLSQSLNYQWLTIPQYLHFILILTGAIEFMCSQVPSFPPKNLTLSIIIVSQQVTKSNHLHLFFDWNLHEQSGGIKEILLKIRTSQGTLCAKYAHSFIALPPKMNMTLFVARWSPV